MSNAHQSEEIEVRYTPAMVRGAVRTFVGHRLRQQVDLRIILAASVLALSIPVLAPRRYLAIVYAGVVAFPVIISLMIWLAQHLYKMAALRRMGEPVAWVRVGEGTASFRSNAGKAELPIASITSVWRRHDCLVLAIGSNRFTILPTAGLPDAWRAQLEGLK